MKQLVTLREARQLAAIHPKGWRLDWVGGGWSLSLEAKGQAYVLATAPRSREKPRAPRVIRNIETATRVCFEQVGLREVLLCKD